ncbi:MAG: peptidase S8 [Candidatus Riflebacteria bacterium HGW-Riflebacteria-1]|jgi:hypothetical protein|nr:MAG: peptidase S8 [Candidatus Riflebacteria bacterium HGW-Riflebacteria-1]
MQRQLPHLPIKVSETTVFKAKGGGSSTPIAFKDRTIHSAILRQQLEKAWSQAAEEKIVHHTSRSGIYLEFRGDDGYELAVESLESLREKDPSKRVKLLNVRKESVQVGEKIESVTVATIFTPSDKKNLLFDKLEEYASKDTPKGKPRNAKLFGNISNIRMALDVEPFWQDSKNLIPSDQPEWCEVWLSSDQLEVIKGFEDLLAEVGITSKPGFIRFPERTVKLVHASMPQLAKLTRNSPDIAEYRRAKETAAFWCNQSNKDQVEWARDFLKRLKVENNATVSVCILDTGVNNGHPLLKPILSDEDCQAVKNVWGSNDLDGHGTLMAGLTAYGDLREILSHNAIVQQRHFLESVKILPHSGKNEPHLWGLITQQGVYKAEAQAPERKRISCMAVSADDSRDNGRPSSWSAAIDKLTSGAEDDNRRLLIVCAGNLTTWDKAQYYPDTQLENSVHDPGQSWNALTVGAMTELVYIEDRTFAGFQAIAPAGGLSPFTTTSLTWENKWPIKPEIVMEGGNSIPGIMSGHIDECCVDLSLLSTHFKPHDAHFAPFNMTSAATAQAAWFAAQIQAQYPDYWPETIRALMVHSADWTKAMKEQFPTNDNKNSYEKLLKSCGYGLPNLEKALFSASSSLTLVAQTEIQPFVKNTIGGGYKRDMHLFELPWPKEVLRELPDNIEVQMRVTLSYFIEPSPGERGRNSRYRYASHGLRFDLNTPLEDMGEFVNRINKEAREEEDNTLSKESAAKYWTFGKTIRDKGSIHSDVWKGSAHDLAESNYIVVYPVTGWWKDQSQLKKHYRKTRYSLIVSIHTSDQKVDIYTPVAIKLGVVIPVEVKV